MPRRAECGDRASKEAPARAAARCRISRTEDRASRLSPTRSVRPFPTPVEERPFGDAALGQRCGPGGERAHRIGRRSRTRSEDEHLARALLVRLEKRIVTSRPPCPAGARSARSSPQTSEAHSPSAKAMRMRARSRIPASPAGRSSTSAQAATGRPVGRSNLRRLTAHAGSATAAKNHADARPRPPP
jgi:hypothetical protein